MNTSKTPFSSNTFIYTWKKHFLNKKNISTFNYIKGVSFYKNKFSTYFNIGRNLTKGNNYSFQDTEDYKNKTFVIFDVLPNNLLFQHKKPKSLGLLKSTQYPGFLVELDKFENIKNYLNTKFSNKTRMKIRRYNKRLDTCFNISCKMFFGDISKSDYDSIFDHFLYLMKKRYTEKKEYCNNIQSSEWNFYKDVAYPLILEKKASLFVIYNNSQPIAVTYNYHEDSTVIEAIKVYDTDYSKFNIGFINNLKLIEWCFENNVKKFDFSKGYFDYKKRFSTLEYDFEYHILYDKNSIISKIKAFVYYCFFESKKFLRTKNLDKKLNRLIYNLKYNNKESIPKFDIKKIDKIPSAEHLEKINMVDTDLEIFSYLKKNIHDFQYLAAKPIEEINFYKVKNENNTFIFSSDTLIYHVTLQS